MVNSKGSRGQSTCRRPAGARKRAGLVQAALLGHQNMEYSPGFAEMGSSPSRTYRPLADCSSGTGSCSCVKPSSLSALELPHVPLVKKSWSPTSKPIPDISTVQLLPSWHSVVESNGPLAVIKPTLAWNPTAVPQVSPAGLQKHILKIPATDRMTLLTFPRMQSYCHQQFQERHWMEDQEWHFLYHSLRESSGDLHFAC